MRQITSENEIVQVSKGTEFKLAKEPHGGEYV